MPPTLLVWAVHLSDGVLTWPAWTGGIVIAVALVAVGAWRIRDDEVPRIALLTAAFFIVSLIHVRVWPTSVHLVLNGLVGVMLGRRAFLAISIGLVLQLFLLWHGGLQTLGVNTIVIAVPAVLAGWFFHVTRPAASLPTEARASRVWPLLHPATMGFVAGGGALLLTAALNSLVLVFAGVEDWRIVAAGIFIAHLPLALIEGLITGFAASFLMKVQPALLGIEPAAASAATESALVDRYVSAAVIAESQDTSAPSPSRGGENA